MTSIKMGAPRKESAHLITLEQRNGINSEGVSQSILDLYLSAPPQDEVAP